MLIVTKLTFSGENMQKYRAYPDLLVSFGWHCGGSWKQFVFVRGVLCA